ncbi:MAG: LiaI-LiaF-like domain-containing protein [Acidobacteriota bacterium]
MNESRDPSQTHRPTPTGSGAPAERAPDLQAPGASTPPPDAGPAFQSTPPPGMAHRGGWAREPFNPFDPRRKSPGFASFLSLVPGLGQIYVGDYQRGFAHALVIMTTIALLAVPRLPDVMYPFLGLFLPFFWLYNIVDAGRRAAFCNQVLEGADAPALRARAAASRRGSLAAGVSLIAAGLLLLLHTRFSFSLDWLEDWWPMAPILFGVYLVARAIQERRSQV